MIGITSFVICMILYGFTVWFSYLRIKGSCREALYAAIWSAVLAVIFSIFTISVQLPPGPHDPTALSYNESDLLSACVEAERGVCDVVQLRAQIMKSHGL